MNANSPQKASTLSITAATTIPTMVRTRADYPTPRQKKM
jgi:hypothetical protein